MPTKDTTHIRVKLDEKAWLETQCQPGESIADVLRKIRNTQQHLERAATEVVTKPMKGGSGLITSSSLTEERKAELREMVLAEVERIKQAQPIDQPEQSPGTPWWAWALLIYLGYMALQQRAERTE